MRELLLIIMSIVSFSSMTYALHSANKQSFEIVSGVVTVRGEVYSCQKWNYTKSNNSLKIKK